MTGSKLDGVKSLLGEPLLLTGEDRAAYDELLGAVTEAVQPTDMLEQIWTNEAVEKQWGELAFEYTFGVESSVKKVDELLSQAKLTKDAVHAQAMALHIDTFEKFDRLIWAAESRRDTSLREIEHHRAPFGRSLRRAIAQVEAVEVRKLESPTKQKRAA